MSLSEYQTIKVSDSNYSLEVTVDTCNTKNMKCSLRCFKQIEIEGYPLLTVYPKVIIDTMGNNVVSEMDVTYKVDEEVIVEKKEVVAVEEVVNEVVVDELVVHEVVVDEVVEADEVVNEVVEEVVEEVVDEVIDDKKVEEHNETKIVDDDNFVIEDKFIDETRWEEEGENHNEEEKDKVDDMLILFNKQMEAIIIRLDEMAKKDKASSETEAIPETKAHMTPHPPPKIEEEKVPMKPKPPTQPPPHVHHPPKIEIIEEERMPLKPKPPTYPPPPPKPSESPLIAQISKLQKSFFFTENIDKSIVKIILDHMKCIEHFNLSGIEKKTVVLNSIETIMNNNDIDNIPFVMELSSQLIDTFIAFDKDQLHIIDKKPSALSCFPCS